MSSLDTGPSPLDKPPAGPVSDFERRVAEAMNSPYVQMALLKPFMEYSTQYLALNQPPLSIANLIGFTQFTASTATLETAEGTASTSYTDLATAGPELTGLSDGQYLVLYGAGMYHTLAGGASFMSFSVNGAAASADEVRSDASAASLVVPGARAALATLSGDGNNTVRLKYRTASGTATFQSRWLVVLKTANS